MHVMKLCRLVIGIATQKPWQLDWSEQQWVLITMIKETDNTVTLFCKEANIKHRSSLDRSAYILSFFPFTCKQALPPPPHLLWLAYQHSNSKIQDNWINLVYIKQKIFTRENSHFIRTKVGAPHSITVLDSVDEVLVDFQSGVW